MVLENKLMVIIDDTSLYCSSAAKYSQHDTMGSNRSNNNPRVIKAVSV